MKNFLVKTLVIGVALVGLSWASQAQQIVDNVSITPQVIATLNTPQALPGFTVPQFNTGLGTLTSVTLTLTPNLTGSGITIYNFNESTGVPFTGGYIVGGGINGYTGSVSVASIAGLSGSWSSGQDIENFTLTNGIGTFATYVLQDLPAPSTNVVVLTDGAMAPFEGMGTLSLPATAYGDWDVQVTDGSVFVGAVPMAGANLNVVYDYTIPEPTTIGLVAIGLLGAFTIRRRKS